MEDLFISLQYGLDFHPAFDDAIDEVHAVFAERYDTGITLAYCAL